MDENPYAAPNVENIVVSSKGKKEKRYEGIGGWLIVVLLQLILTPIASVVMIGLVYVNVIATEEWNTFVDSASPDYDPMLMPAVVFQIIGNLAFIPAAILGLVLMFRKLRMFPNYMIGFYVASLIFVIIDAAITSQTTSLEGKEEAYRDVARSILPSVIWISYMCVSKRVKATFVN